MSGKNICQSISNENIEDKEQLEINLSIEDAKKIVDGSKTLLEFEINIHDFKNDAILMQIEGKIYNLSSYFISNYPFKC